MQTFAPRSRTPLRPLERTSGPGNSPDLSIPSSYVLGVPAQLVVVLGVPGIVALLDLFQRVLGFFPGLVRANQLCPIGHGVLFDLMRLDVVPVLRHVSSSSRLPSNA